jgi:effector-binding domain-containing protein
MQRADPPDSMSAMTAYRVQVKDIPAQSVASVRGRAPTTDVARFLREAYEELFGYLDELGIGPAGPPLAVYHGDGPSEGYFDIEACVPLATPVPPRGRIAARELAATTVASTLHGGPYDEEHPAYRALLTWMEENGHQPGGPPRELYLVSPGDTDDPADYRTEIVWPIR